MNPAPSAVKSPRPTWPRPDGASAMLLLAGAGAVVAYSVGALATPDLPPWLVGALGAAYPVPYAVSALACVIAASGARDAHERTAWRLLALALASILVGMAGVLAGRAWRLAPVLWAADVAALLYYPFLAAALLVLGRARRTTFQRQKLALDVAITVVASTSAAAFVWLRRAELGWSDPAASSFVYILALPAAAACVLVAAAVVVIGRGGQALGPRLALLLGAAVASAISDAVTVLAPATWGAFSAPTRSLLALGIGLAAAWRGGPALTAPAARGAPARRVPSLVPYVAGVLLAALLASELPRIGQPSDRALVAGVLVLTSFIVLRQLVALREIHEISRARASEETRFRALVQRSSDAFVITDGDGVVRYHSPALCAMLHAPGASLSGASLLPLVADDDRARVRAVLRDAQADAEASATVFFATADRQGALEAVVSNRLDDPAIQGLVLNVRDVTDRRRLEGQLRQAQKLEALGRLSGGIAHDFNNLLAAIIGFADLVEQGIERGEPRRDDAVAIRETAMRAAALTQQLLAFSRRQPSVPRRVVIDDMIAAMLPLLRQLTGTRVTLEWAPGAGRESVMADPGQLEQVVLNLVVNANDATPRNGRIIVATARLAEDTPPGAGGGIRLTVSDTGAGMSEETMARAFEPFFTTKPEGEGTGLGLATVYGVVSQAGGQVSVQSAIGEGTTIVVELPGEPPRRVSGETHAADVAALAP